MTAEAVARATGLGRHSEPGPGRAAHGRPAHVRRPPRLHHDRRRDCCCRRSSSQLGFACMCSIPEWSCWPVSGPYPTPPCPTPPCPTLSRGACVRPLPAQPCPARPCPTIHAGRQHRAGNRGGGPVGRGGGPSRAEGRGRRLPGLTCSFSLLEVNHFTFVEFAIKVQ